ncbi:MAG: hypothetical protein ACI4I1_10490 [Oscillospiraceae bacterium]
MELFKCIDGLLHGTRYLAWGIGIVGIVASIVLFFANLSLGFASAAVCIAALLLSIAVALLLIPKQFAKGFFGSKTKNVIGGSALVIAVAVMGIVYAANGGFPTLNLLFA